jgi:hypothetical protein
MLSVGSNERLHITVPTNDKGDKLLTVVFYAPQNTPTPKKSFFKD